MKKLASILSVLLLALLLAGCGQDSGAGKETNQPDASADYPKVLTDARGVEVTIEEKPSRIVSTTLALDEYLMEMVDPSSLVAVTKMSTDPGISNVAGLTDQIETKIESVTSELVISLEPDLVIIPNYLDPAVLEQLDAAGITTYQIKDDSSFDGILDAVEEIGEIVGEEEKAAEIVADVEKRMASLEEKASGQKDKKRVLYWTEYNSSVTSNTTIGEMIELAGGINVVEEAGIKGGEYPDYPNLSKELLIELDPDVIITSDWQYDGSEATFVEDWKNDPALKNVKAFSDGEVHVIDSAHLTTASYYVIEGAEDIYEMLYGE